MVKFKPAIWDIASRLAQVQPRYRDRYQCPYSKCFPSVYEDSELPCVRTAFKDFSRLHEHIRKCHFGEDASSQPGEANRKGKKEIPPRSQSFSHTLTPEKESQFIAWREQPSTRRMNGETRYWALCRLLFDLEDDELFDGQTPLYDYLLLGHSSCSPLVESSEGNLEDQLVQLSHVPTQSLQIDPLMLDNAGWKPSGSWSVQHGFTSDSGYDSLPTHSGLGDEATQPLGSYPQPSFTTSFPPVHNNDSGEISEAHPSLGDVYLPCLPEEDCRDSFGTSS
ncbi:hypothetical protein GGR53DRAFT_343400 [Hypoxylon sp. FL1150]|nr:hypothetical protein GGR53DRAFT_343400 [Hypoxylon sp. FL1150]